MAEHRWSPSGGLHLIQSNIVWFNLYLIVPVFVSGSVPLASRADYVLNCERGTLVLSLSRRGASGTGVLSSSKGNFTLIDPFIEETAGLLRKAQSGQNSLEPF